jgi:hypothetical protein
LALIQAAPAVSPLREGKPRREACATGPMVPRSFLKKTFVTASDKKRYKKER